MSHLVVAVVGAESTGKTVLTQALAQALRARGLDAVVVPETLRAFCDAHQRTPLRHEQVQIAAEQTRAIAQAAQLHSVVLADTTALMTAVYSQMVFDDTTLYTQALQDHALADLTLLTSLDLAWHSDGIQRDGPHVREPVDTLIRQALQAAGLPYAVVAGQGASRLRNALAAIEHHLAVPAARARGTTTPRWRWVCEHCDDGECEQHALSRSPLASLQR